MGAAVVENAKVRAAGHVYADPAAVLGQTLGHGQVDEAVGHEHGYVPHVDQVVDGAVEQTVVVQVFLLVALDEGSGVALHAGAVVVQHLGCGLGELHGLGLQDREHVELVGFLSAVADGLPTFYRGGNREADPGPVQTRGG